MMWRNKYLSLTAEYIRMSKVFKLILPIIALIFAVLSCRPQNDINYMQDIESIAVEASVKNTVNTIQPGDQLVIFVSAKDMDVVRPFNQTYSSSGSVAQYSQSRSGAQAASTSGPGTVYTVDTDGYINYPVIGKISTTGLNQEQFREKLTLLLTEYVKNPVVDLRTNNFKVTVLGEVANPGTYNIPDGSATVLSALGLAGDLTIYGVRTNVLVVRNNDGEITRQRLNLTSAEFINSPYYYLKQNDVIYVEANTTKQNTARTNPNIGLYLSGASLLITLVAIILRK